jgi:spermidine synthase
MALAWSSNNTNLTKKRKYYNYINTEYYNKDILEGAFAIPNFIKISK